MPLVYGDTNTTIQCPGGGGVSLAISLVFEGHSRREKRTVELRNHLLIDSPPAPDI